MSVSSLAMQDITQDGDVGEGIESSLNQSIATRNKGESEYEPLSPSEFSLVITQLDQMGLTWTSDLPPNLVAKDGETNGGLASDKLKEIQDAHPMFPNEIGYVIWYALTGTEPLMEMVGSTEDLLAKVAIVREFLITPEFRDEFFFRHMLKVPSFGNVDWEVILKTSERGVQSFPGNAYALVSVLLEHNEQYSEKSERFTFAINEQRLEKLQRLFAEIHEALKRARQFGDQLNQYHGSKG